jgi:hypothetical protein
MLPISPSQEDFWAPVSRVRPRGGNHREVLAAWFAGAPVAAANELTGTGYAEWAADDAGAPPFAAESATGRIPFLIF